MCKTHKTESPSAETAISCSELFFSGCGQGSARPRPAEHPLCHCWVRGTLHSPTTVLLKPSQQHHLAATMLMPPQLTGGYFILVCTFGKQEFRLRGSRYFVIQAPKSPLAPRKAQLSSERSRAAQAFPWPQLRLVLPQVPQSQTRSPAGVCCESQETRDGKFINMPRMVYGKRL